MSTDREKKSPRFCINDHLDVLVEIIKRLDGRSVGVAACVCQLWSTVARTDSIWEHICLRHLSSPLPSSTGIRTVVSALGGHRRLYMLCIHPVLSRLGEPRLRATACSSVEIQLSLSLFCVDYYERLGASPSSSRFGDVAGSSLMFLCKPLNV